MASLLSEKGLSIKPSLFYSSAAPSDFEAQGSQMATSWGGASPSLARLRKTLDSAVVGT